jgi:hypothetical protein
MADDWMDWTASSGALEAVVKSWLWRADVAHKKLSPSDADAMRQLEDEIQVSLQQLQNVLSKVADHSAAEEVERCVARLLHAVSWISQLHPAPTPNARKTVTDKAPGIGRAVRKANARPLDEAYEAVFFEVYADGQWKPGRVRQAMELVAPRLKNLRIRARDYHAVRDRALNFLKRQNSLVSGRKQN